jgi:two-component sensor histidine kinase
LLKKAILESPEGIIVFALDVRYCYTDFTVMHQRTMKEIWGADIAVGANMLEVITDESDREKARTNFDRALAGERFILEEAYGDEKLRRTYFDNRYSPMLAEDNSIVGLSVFVVDVTDRKLAEEKITHLLADKELLLHEVHHRIKNNMNTMMSLLSLQARSVNDVGSVAALTDARRRMQSMTMLYDKLYRSKGFKELSLREYLSPLVREILDNFPNAEMVTIESRVEDIILGARILSPIGIVVNELLTNIMKHAFVDRDRGVIRISASHKGHHATISVQDDGKGLPEGFDIAASSGFGLQLVSMLMQQIGGSMRIERGKGTTFVLEFDV